MHAVEDSGEGCGGAGINNRQSGEPWLRCDVVCRRDKVSARISSPLTLRTPLRGRAGGCVTICPVHIFPRHATSTTGCMPLSHLSLASTAPTVCWHSPDRRGGTVLGLGVHGTYPLPFRDSETQTATNEFELIRNRMQNSCQMYLNTLPCYAGDPILPSAGRDAVHTNAYERWSAIATIRRKSASCVRRTSMLPPP